MMIDNIQRNEISEDYNKIKDCVIYLDWNIVSYIFGLSTLSTELSNTVDCFKQILFSELDMSRCCIPYSFCHYRDILMGDEQLYKEKNECLHKLSRDWRISEDKIKKENIRLDKCLDSEKDFEIYRNNTKFSKTPLNIPRELLEMYRTSSSNDEKLNKLKEDIYAIIDDNKIPAGLSILRVNRKLRSSKIMLNSKPFKYPSISKEVIDKDIDIKKKVEECLKQSSIDYKLLQPILDTIYNITKTILSTFSNQVLKLCQLCDFVGLTNEKLSKDTSFDSQINDILHISLGLRSSVFITEDKNLQIKAKFIKKWLGLKTIICDMDSFIVFILKQGLKTTKKTSGPMSCNVKFCSGENVIKEYSIDY